MEDGTSYFQQIKQHLPALSTVGAVAGFISDVASPLAPVALYAAIALTILAVAAFIGGQILKIRHARSVSIISATIALCNALVAVTQFLTGNADAGVAATYVNEIAKIQKQIGITNEQIIDIKETVANVSVNTDQIAKNTGDIVISMKDVAQNLEKFAKQGGIIQNAKTYSEKYHNARLYAQRGEVDLALNTYTEILKSKVYFADPIRDLVSILLRSYGKSGSIRYINDKLKSEIPKPLYMYANQLLADKVLTETIEYISTNSRDFPPIIPLVITQSMYDVAALTWRERIIIDRAVKAILPNISNGDFLSFYIDQIIAKTDFDILNDRIQNGDPILNSVADLSQSPIVLFISNESTIPKKTKGLSIRFSNFFDKMDLSKPMMLCAHNNEDQKCADLTIFKCNKNRQNKSEKNNIGCIPFENIGAKNNVMFSGPIDNGNGINLKLIVGNECISQISYQDINGNIIVSKAQDISAGYIQSSFANNKSMIKDLSNCQYKLFEIE